MATIRDIVLGIRHSTSAADKNQLAKLTPEAYRDVQRFKLRGDEEFEIKVYAPHVFAHLRKIHGISAKSFLGSWILPAKKEDLTLDESTGRSGSMFYMTEDKKYFFKTILHAEVGALMVMLEEYVEHLSEHKRSFIMKVFGMYRIESGRSQTWLIVMGNVLPTKLKIHEKYDLKGRTAKPGKSYAERGKTSEGPTKDNEINRTLKFLHEEDKKLFIKQVTEDINLLGRKNIMDYSLLVGIHHVGELDEEEMNRMAEVIETGSDPERARNLAEKAEADEKGDEGDNAKEEKGGKKQGRTRKKAVSEGAKSKPKKGKEAPGENLYTVMIDDIPPLKSDINTWDTKKILEEERFMSESCKSPFGFGMECENPITGAKEIVFIGIIDCLTNYHLGKRVAHFMKKFIWESSTLSTVRAEFYAERFWHFMTHDLLGEEVDPEKEQERRNEADEPQLIPELRVNTERVRKRSRSLGYANVRRNTISGHVPISKGQKKETETEEDKQTDDKKEDKSKDKKDEKKEDKSKDKKDEKKEDKNKDKKDEKKAKKQEKKEKSQKKEKNSEKKEGKEEDDDQDADDPLSSSFE